MRTSKRVILPLATSIALLLANAHGIEIQKFNNTDPLNSGFSWSGGVVPGLEDVALFDGAIAAQFTVPLGGDLSWQGIRVTNVGGTRNAGTTNVTISNGGSANTLSIGSAGIDMSGALQTLAIQSRLTLTADQSWIVANANNAGNPAGLSQNEDLVFLSQVAGTPMNLGGFAVTKLGAGTAAFSSGHTVSNGVFNVNGGVLHFQGGGSRITTVDNTVAFNVNAATLRFAAQSGSGGVTTQVDAPITLHAGSTLALHLNQANTVNLTGNISVAGNATWTVFGGSTGNQTTFSGNLLGSGNVNFLNTNTEATGAGILRMSGDNSGYSGAFTINAATGARTLRLTSPTAGSANATWSVGTGNVLQVDGVTVQLGTLNGAGVVTNPNTLDLGTIEVGSGTFTGVINNGASAALAVTKVGPGTLTLTGANTYTGPTIVSGGVLMTTTAHTGATTVTVADDATFGLRLAAANATYETTSITTGSISGATVRIDTAGFGNPAAPVINTTTFSPLAPTTFELLGSNISSGIIRLLDYVGTIEGGGFDNLSVALPFRVGGTLIDNSVDTAIDVNITSETPRWNGDISSDWDINDGAVGGTPNWRTLTSGAVTHYIQGVNTDAVIFDDTAANPIVNLTTTLTPVGATVNNTTTDFTFGGPGKLSGTSTLTKNGAGTLILANATPYDHTGGTFINEGVLQIGDGITPAAGFLPDGNVVNNATLRFNRPDDSAFASILSGTGSIVKDQASAVTFNSAVTFAGPININAGALQFASGGNLSNVIAGPGNLTVQAGILQLSGPAANTHTGLTTVSSGTLQLNKPAGLDAIAGTLLVTGNGAVTFVQPNQIADTATVIYDKAPNGGNLILTETVGAINMINGADAGAQVQAQNGFSVTGILSGSNTSVFSVASNHSGSVGGLNVSGSAIIRIAANGNPSTLLVGPLGITASGGTIQVGQGTGAFDAVLNLGGNVTTTGDLNFTDGNFGGAQLRQINLGLESVFTIGASTNTTIAPDLAGGGGIMKEGDGTLTLTPASVSTYIGPTTVNAGSLLLNGSLSGTASVDIMGTGTLGGTGTISPALGGSSILHEGGKLAPAQPFVSGVLTVNLSGGGALDLSEGVGSANSQALAFDIDFPFFSDKVLLAGGSLHIGVDVLEFDDFAFALGFSFDPTATYTLFDGDTEIIGALGPQTVGVLGGQFFELQFADAGKDLALVPVPEPASSVFLLCAAGVFALRRRRD